MIAATVLNTARDLTAALLASAVWMALVVLEQPTVAPALTTETCEAVAHLRGRGPSPGR
jgi:hypothetical protein